MATKTQAVWDSPPRRRDPRRMAGLPVDVTVVRAEVSDQLPGRCLNVSARGIGAVLPGVLRAGESVRIELALPMKERWQASAIVRHSKRLDHGFEFTGLTGEQQQQLEEWLRSETPDLAREPETKAGPRLIQDSGQTTSATSKWRLLERALLMVFLALVFVAGVTWRWQRGWKEFESALPAEARTEKATPEARIPAEEMASRLVHHVDPEYPDAARSGLLSGVVVLDLVVGRDGTVVEVSPENGPEIFVRAAMEAVRWWRFEPYQIGGHPVVVGTTVAIEFRP